MRILHVLDHSLPKQSGYVFRTMNIVQQQKALGWDPILVTTRRHGDSENAIEHVDGWDFHRTPKARVSHLLPAVLKDLFEMRKTASHIKKLIAEQQPDIIHAHSPVLNFFPAKWASRSVPVVYEIRAFWEDAAVDHGSTREGSMRYRLTRALESQAIRSADAVTTICEGLRTDIVNRGVPSEKVTVIPNAVNSEAFQPIMEKDKEILRSLKLSNEFVFAFIGSFYSYEGLEFLIKTMPKLLKVNSNTKLLLVGGGPDEEKMKKATLDLGLGNDVIFTGRVPHSDVRRYYSLADAMIYPRHSIRLTELVTPLKPLEAMAFGKLVLASDIGGHRELIEEGRTGFLFQAGDETSLANEYARLLATRESWPNYMANGRNFVENVRSWKNSVANYRNVYGRLLSKQIP